MRIRIRIQYLDNWYYYHSLLLNISLLFSVTLGPLPSSLSIILILLRIPILLSINTGSNQSLIITFLNFGISNSIYTSSSYSSIWDWSELYLAILLPFFLFEELALLYFLFSLFLFFWPLIIYIWFSSLSFSCKWISSSSTLFGSRSLQYLHAILSMN